ncbi:MarR family winged helix-turn-helix transcriptional regulator [uncultured Roseibium sp.]|uniref:MarR family winged helix-turn-helix transcriptional regulator n=1 Tax=uncultured Roseibium sp. TaxID=1936171 RepID=UPI0032179B10
MTKETPSSSLSKNRLRLWLKLLKTSSSIEAELRRRLRDQFGSTLPRFDVMSALARTPEGLKMSEISSLLKVSNGNVTGIVERLVEDGHALRLAVPGDRRANRVKLTAAGSKAFAELAAEHEGWINEMLGEFGPEQIETLSDLLEAVLHPAEKDEKSGSAANAE